MFASYISDYVFERKYCHFFLDTAAAIPPAISPTAVAAMPKPITPSAMKKKKFHCFIRVKINLISSCIERKMQYKNY